MESIEKSKKKVDQLRSKRQKESWPSLSLEEKESLVHRYHPDYKKEAYRAIRVGPNQGDETVHELADLLEGESPVADQEIALTPHHQADILIIGGGGAGATAALTA
ncbi:MAG TPA: hypothetical protein VIK48_06870, partial [Candidatus Manganitrophaceae bacterium]